MVKLGNIVKRIFGGTEQQSNSDLLAELMECLNRGQLCIEELGNRNRNMRILLQNEIHENRRRELLNAQLRESNEKLKRAAKYSTEMVDVILIGFVQVAMKGARTLQMLQSYLSDQNDTTRQFEVIRDVIMNVMMIVFSVLTVLLLSRFKIWRYALLLGCVAYAIQYAELVISTKRTVESSWKIVTAVAYGVGQIVFDAARLWTIKNRSQPAHLARNICTTGAIGNVIIILMALTCFPTFEASQSHYNATSGFPDLNGNSTVPFDISEAGFHDIFMMLVLSVAIAIFSVFLLKDNKEDFDSLEPIPSVNSILPADIDQASTSVDSANNSNSTPSTREYHSADNETSNSSSTYVTVNDDAFENRESWICCSLPKRQFSDSEAGLALSCLLVFLILSSMYAGYIGMFWTFGVVSFLVERYPKNFLAFPQYIVALGTTISLCAGGLACCFNRSYRLLFVLFSVASVFLVCELWLKKDMIVFDIILLGIVSGIVHVFVILAVNVIVCVNFKFLYGFVKFIECSIGLLLTISVDKAVQFMLTPRITIAYFAVVFIAVLFAMLLPFASFWIIDRHRSSSNRLDRIDEEVLLEAND